MNCRLAIERFIQSQVLVPGVWKPIQGTRIAWTDDEIPLASEDAGKSSALQRNHLVRTDFELLPKLTLIIF